MLQCQICTQKDFYTPWFERWCKELKQKQRFHRKQWEQCVIPEALFERGLLKPTKRGLGFAVGEEPLPALFAKYGVEILATDLDTSTETAKLWDNGQLLKDKKSLFHGIGNRKQFDKLVQCEPLDMNAIPARFRKRKFDFTWSTCSFEHLGSIEKGLSFLLNQMECIKSGGWAVHSTEYNLSSNKDTIESENLVIFRQKDVEKVIDQLETSGHYVEPFSVDYGSYPLDKYVDLPPYSQDKHLRLLLGNYVSTSVLLIIQKDGISKGKMKRKHRQIESYLNALRRNKFQIKKKVISNLRKLQK